MLQELRDLVLRIDQRYWEHKAKLACESGPTPRTDRKFGNKSLKPESANEASGSKDNKKPKNRHKRDQTYWTSSVRMVNSPPRNTNHAWMVSFAYCVPVAAT